MHKMKAERLVDPTAGAPRSGTPRSGTRRLGGRRTARLFLAVLVTALAAASAGGKLVAAAVAADPVIAAAGDVACSPSDQWFNGGLGSSTYCRQQYTSDILVGRGLTAVLPIGDEQYACGSPSEFAGAFNPTWGRVKTSIYPVPGNHEYQTTGASDCSASPDAAGYFAYFGAAAGDPSKGYYSYDIGGWHLIALNSNSACAAISCAAGSAQEQWLRADLAAHPAACTLAYWHHPFFSSTVVSPSVGAFWQDLYAAGADIVLNAHIHNYERFALQDPSGNADPAKGIREFIVGTGGKSQESFGAVAPNSEVRNSGTFGVLQLTLHTGSYDWTFVSEAGKTFTDAGSTTCHRAAPDTQPPSVPSGLVASGGVGSVSLSWGASTDNVGVVRYDVYRSSTSGFVPSVGNRVGQPVGTSFVDSGLAAGTYYYVVQAEDAAGNLSGPSNQASAVVSAPPPPSAGLVAAYSFNEGSGVSVADASGSGNVGTVSNASWVAGGKYGAALSFNGSSSLVTVSDSSSLRLSGGMTLEAWVNPSALGSSWRDVLFKEQPGDMVYSLYAHDGVRPLGQVFIGGEKNVLGTAGLPLNGWTHLAVTYDGASLRLYVNGALAQTAPLSGTIAGSTGVLHIGGNSVWGEYFQGLIDEVRVYNRALSQADIQTDLNTPIRP
jgi:chitodextrinase